MRSTQPSSDPVPSGPRRRALSLTPPQLHTLTGPDHTDAVTALARFLGELEADAGTINTVGGSTSHDAVPVSEASVTLNPSRAPFATTEDAA